LRIINPDILGINRRNADLIEKHNPRKFYPNVDSKLRCKTICADAEIATPELFGTFSFVGELKNIQERLAPYESFVLKPDHGSGGEGVTLVDQKEGKFLSSSQNKITTSELRHFVANALYGMYSLGGQPDRVLIESKVVFDPVFEKISYKGVPDIRVIIFLGIPVMAMLRLPTSTSGGRANLHQGAIGVGVELLTGLTRGGVIGSTPVDKHPDTEVSISGVQIPYWEEILQICFKASNAFGLGYFGLDLVIDRTKGPLVLEGNARPGLAIQLANHIGLRPRLEFLAEKAELTSESTSLSRGEKMGLVELVGNIGKYTNI